MPALILLNGPPASGKSTLAARVVAERPLALNLDIDVVRSLLGDRLAQPHEAGLAARALAIEMARTHLGAGRDVVVPQYVGRLSFIEELEALAIAAGATFIEVVLTLGRDDAVAAFAERSREAASQTHVDAAALVERYGSPDQVGAMYDVLQDVMRQRPRSVVVPVVLGDIDATFQTLLTRLHERGLRPPSR